jgi:hypothetical protein
MPPGDGWYLLGPLIAVVLAGGLGVLFRRMSLEWTVGYDENDPLPDGLAIFGFPEDYGLLYPAAVTDEPALAEEIRRLLGDAGIRATQAVGRDGRVAILVFAEELEEARRLVGGSPAL